MRLTNGVRSTQATSVSVIGSDIYVTGYEYSGTKDVAKYWKNQVAVNLPGGLLASLARAMTVSESDVYVCGMFDGDREEAAVWKNGVAETLNNGSEDNSAQDMVVNGSDVYVASYTTMGIKTVAAYYKNRAVVPMDISDAADHSFAYRIAYSDGTMHCAGMEYTGGNFLGKYWKNGKSADIGQPLSAAMGVALSGKDVFIVGEEITGSTYAAKCIMNGKELPLMLKKPLSSAVAVAVKER